MSVICFDHYELGNVLVCADCADDASIDRMIDYSALNAACYRRQYREQRFARLKDPCHRHQRYAVSINHSSLERAIDHCNPDAEQAYNTVRILHDNLTTAGGVRFSQFDPHPHDCILDWTNALKNRILARIAASPPLTATTWPRGPNVEASCHRPCFQRPMA